MNIVQIGANRGNDDLTLLINGTQPNKLILVEPMSLHNDTLKNCYHWVNDLVIENFVVDIKTGEDVNFYYHPDDSPGYEVSSLSKEHIYERHSQLSEDKIKTLKIKTININDLFEKHELKIIDILFIDAEGNDDTIIKTIDFNKFFIKNIYFENLHLKNDEIYEYLNSCEYTTNKNVGTNGWCSLATKEISHYYNTLGGEEWFNYGDFYSYVVDKLKTDSKMVEVGSWMGKSISYFVIESILKNKNIKCTCVDIWEPYNEIPDHPIHKNDGAYKKFLYNTSKIKQFITPIKGKSIDVSTQFNDEEFDFIFIDAAHDYDNVYNDIKFWAPKLKKGGIIGGHDYYDNNDVVRAVKTFFNGYEIKINGPCWYIENFI